MSNLNLNFLAEQTTLQQSNISRKMGIIPQQVSNNNLNTKSIFPFEQEGVASDMKDIISVTLLGKDEEESNSIFPSVSENAKATDMLWRHNVSLINPTNTVFKQVTIMDKWDNFFEWLKDFFRSMFGHDERKVGQTQPEPTKEELQEKLDEINGSIDEKKAILDKIYSGECESLNDLKDVSDKKYDDYKTALMEHNPELAEQVFGLEDKINEYDSQIDKHQKTILESKTKIATLDKEIESLTSEKDEIQNQINELLFSSKGLMVPFAQAELSAKLEELFDKKQQVEEQIAKKEQEKQTLQVEMGFAQQGINELIMQKAVATAQRKDLEEQIPADATDVHSAKDGYYTAKDEYTNAKKEAITTTKTELEKLEAEKAQVEKDLEAKEAEENGKIKDPSKMTQAEIKEEINRLEEERRSLMIERSRILRAATINIDTDRIAEIEKRLLEINLEITNLKSYLQPEIQLLKNV